MLGSWRRTGRRGPVRPGRTEAHGEAGDLPERTPMAAGQPVAGRWKALSRARGRSSRAWGGKSVIHFVARWSRGHRNTEWEGKNRKPENIGVLELSF